MPGQPGPDRAGHRRPVALVTGAAQGLGHATALRLAADGFAVAVNDITDDGRLTELAARIAGVAVPPDRSDPAGGPAMVKAVPTHLPSLQVPVLNPAAVGMSPLLEAKPNDGLHPTHLRH